METPAQAQSASDRYPQVASPIHTILVLAALGSWAIWHKSFAQLNLTANPNRVRFYIVTVFYEWLLFVLVVAGVGRRGAAFFILFWDQLPFPPPVGPGLLNFPGALRRLWGCSYFFLSLSFPPAG